MKTQIKFAFETFILGLFTGLILAKIGGSIEPLAGIKYHLTELGGEFIKILTNNLIAATATAFGPIMAMRVFNIRSRQDSIGLAYLYMIPILILFINGAATGYLMGNLIEIEPFIDVLLSILPHGILEIPAIVLAGAVGLKNIDEIDKGEVQGGKAFVAVILLLVMAAGIEAGITPQLAGIEADLVFGAVTLPDNVILGERMEGKVGIENNGLRSKTYSLIISTVEGTSSRDVYLSRGENTVAFNITPRKVGTESFTLIIWDDKELAKKVIGMEVAKPRISIINISSPPLYAGEKTTIPVLIKNLDRNRTVTLQFKSSTGAVSLNEVFLPEGEVTRFLYNTSIGQPGPRKFTVSLYGDNVELDNKTANITVESLRIAPKITNISIPSLRANHTSNISVEIINAGNTDGNVSVLIFEAELSQLLQRGPLTQIYLSRTHLEKRIWETSKQVFLKAGETGNIEITVTPERPHNGTLLIFALRKEVVSDASALPIEVL